MPGFIIVAKRERERGGRERERCYDDHVVAAITQTVITQPGNKLKYALGCTFLGGDARKRHPANEGITPNGPIYYLYTRRGPSPASAAFSRGSSSSLRAARNDLSASRLSPSTRSRLSRLFSSLAGISSKTKTKSGFSLRAFAHSVFSNVSRRE